MFPRRVRPISDPGLGSVGRGLISCVRHYADQVSVAEKQEPLVKCFRSLEFIFRFVIQSRVLFSQQSGGQNEESFRTDLYSLFNAFNKMLSISTEAATATQVGVCQSCLPKCVCVGGGSNSSGR